MSERSKSYHLGHPMRIQARQGSEAERLYYASSALPGAPWPMPKAIAPGISPAPLDDLMFHGGRVIPQMEFQNVFLGSAADWPQDDVELIDEAITRAMQDRDLDNVMRQYFPGAKPSCDARPSLLLGGAKPEQLDEPDVQSIVVDLFDGGRLATSDLRTTIFNLVLPPGTVLRLGDSTSLLGLGGYHGSVHIERAGSPLTLYYSANVYSEPLSAIRENGIVVFDRPWKNVVGTLYHELNEFRTDPDVGDAIREGDNDFLGWTSRRGHEVGDQPIAAAPSLELVFQEVVGADGGRKIPVQFMYSNAVHGAEGPIPQPHA